MKTPPCCLTVEDRAVFQALPCWESLLLEVRPATMNGLIRYRLLSIVLLGVLTSALSVVALVQLLTTSTAQRVERARDAVTEEVERLAHEPGDLTEPTRVGF